MATTRIISMHVSHGKTIADCLTDCIDYSKNPEKTQGGELISAYECDPKTADAEFLYSKKYLAEHEGDILLHKAAKKAFDELGVKKLPTVKSLQEEYAKLLAEKKAAYAEYRRSRDEMRELLLHKQNVDRMLGKNEREEEKKKEHDRQ